MTEIHRKLKTPASLTVDEAGENLKNNLSMEEEPKSKIQELHNANGAIYKLIEHLHSLEVPLGLTFQKLRETTTEIQGAITKLIDQSIQKPVDIIPVQEKEADAPKEGKKPEIIVEYDTKKK